MIKIHTFFVLILFSNTTYALDNQNTSKGNPKVTTVPISEEEYFEAYNQYKLQQSGNFNSTILQKQEKWLSEISLNNAPILLKGIFTYLQSRPRRNTSEYSTIVPSFHRFILVGPPGSGKTTLAHAIAHMLEYPVIFIPATSFLGSYRNQTAANITKLLGEYTAAKYNNLVIIIDELHKLFEHHGDDHSDDSQSAAAFWLTLDNIEKHHPNVIIIGTANNVAKLPPEIKSRFSGKIITLPLPDKAQKLHAFKNSISHDKSIVLSSSVDDVFIVEMLEKIRNCSLRDVQLIIDTAKMFYYAKKAMHENNFPFILTRKHFEQALKQLQSESQILEENHIDRLYKKLRPWGLIFSVAVNITTLAKASADLYKKILAFC